MFFLKPKVRVRFAPSPTGFLHVGGLRTALYNYLFAKKNQGSFILRIEDTDRTRVVPGGMENILRTLAAVGLNHDEGPVLEEKGAVTEKGKYGPYLQSNRLEIYKRHSQKLLLKKIAYRCFCSSEELDALREHQQASNEPIKYDRRCLKLSENEIENKIKNGEKYVIRQRMPSAGATRFNDLIHGEITVENSVLEDQILLKADGFPTYNFANIIDDHLMKITHAIRGEEFISSTPKHVLLYAAFGWKPPKFAHLPLLLNADRSKLSKRQGDVAVEDYLKKGYLPEAIINFVALLGWNPSGEKEIFDLRDLISSFEIEKINKSGAIFNIEKLDWLNGVYIRKMDSQRLLLAAEPYLLASEIFGKKDDRWINKLSGEEILDSQLVGALALERERIKKLDELAPSIEFLFKPKLNYDGALLAWKKMKKEDVPARLSALRGMIESIPESDWNESGLEANIKAWIGETGLSNGEVLWPMRVALSGQAASPPPFAIAALLGKKSTLERLEEAIRLSLTL